MTVQVEPTLSGDIYINDELVTEYPSIHKFEENEDVIKGVQWIATLDERTTDICAGLDAEIFPINSGPRPPAHFRCRSTVVPVLKSWKEMGIKLKEAPEGTRTSMDGQVSRKITYGDWLKNQPKDVQNEVLGVKKAELFRTGKVDIKRFTDDKHRPLTLKEISRREGIEI